MGEDVKEAVETEDKAEKTEGPKLYKGEVKTAAELAKGFKGFIPIQPVKRKLNTGYKTTLPPSFVVTKFASGYNGSLVMHYYRPKNKEKSYREVPKDFELNVLSGKRADELREDYKTALKENLGGLVRRIACNIGTDPEIFAVDKKGKIVPAWTYLGSKEKPDNYATIDNYFKGTAYWDGFQAEFTTPGHLTCLAQMSDSVQAALKAVHLKAQKVGGKLTMSSVLPVDPDFLQKAAQEHVQFGCAPSFNLYGLKGNTQEGRDVPYRFAGGHIHMGLHSHHQGGKMPEEMIKEIVRGLDTVLGVACGSSMVRRANTGFRLMAWNTECCPTLGSLTRSS
jgi:hypothetical protein